MAKNNKKDEYKVSANVLKNNIGLGFREILTAMFTNTSLTPSRIIRNRRTGGLIVIWLDGVKTEVKPMPGTADSTYNAFTAALAKRVYGSNSAVNRLVATVIEAEKHVKNKPFQFDDGAVE